MHLKGLNNLELLSLRDTQITDAAVAQLQRALPNCEIEKVRAFSRLLTELTIKGLQKTLGNYPFK